MTVNYTFNFKLGGNLEFLAQMGQRFQQAYDKFKQVSAFAGRFKGAFGSATQSVEELRKKLDQLKGKRDLLVDTRHIKAANKEITALEAKIKHLEGMGVTPGKDKAGGSRGGLLGMVGGLLPAVGIAGLMAGAGTVFGGGMDAEQTKLAYSQFAGAKAAPLYENLNKFANDTSFSNQEILTGGRTMLAAGYSPESITPMLNTVGNISAGAGKNFGDMVGAVAKIKQKGFVDGGELHQEFGGTPLMEVLKKNMGVDGDTLFKMAEKHQIRYGDLVKAMVDMTTGDGIFTGYLQKDMNTARGKLSTFLGNLQYKIQSWGETQNSVLGKVFDFGTQFINGLQPIEDAFSRLLIAFAPLKDSFTGLLISFGLIGDKGFEVQGIIDLIAGTINILATAVGLITSPVGQLILLFAGLAKGVLLLNAYLFVTNAEGVVPLIATFQKLWAVMLANPFTAILTGLVLIGTGIKWAWDNVDGFREGLIKVWEVAKSVFGGLGAAWEAFKNGDFEGLKKAVSTSWEAGMAKAQVAIKADRTARAAAKEPAVGNAQGSKLGTASPMSTAKGGDGGVGKAAGLNATTGGTKSTTINISLKSLVEGGMHLHAATVEEGIEGLEAKMTDMLLRVLNSGSAVAGS